jgi:hypothetical protein
MGHVRRGEARRGEARRGEARRGEARRGEAANGARVPLRVVLDPSNGGVHVPPVTLNSVTKSLHGLPM